MAEDYLFTQDWFHWAPAVWQGLLPMLPARRSFLEIGSFEGRSTVWTVENMLEDGGKLTCIDPWPSGGELTDVYGDETKGTAEDRYDHNVNVLKKRFPRRTVDKRKGMSIPVLASLHARNGPEGTYDFIYIDGLHTAAGVISDACLAWPLLKRGGVVIFDDYLWGNQRDILDRPKLAVDAFLTIFAESAEVVHLGYQVAARKR